MSYYIIIRGPLGCGKTTISEELSKKIDATHIAIDEILANEPGLEDDHEDGYISQKSFKRANEIAAKKAKPLLEQDKQVVFDGNFYWRSAIDYLTKHLDHPYFVFTLKAPLEVCVKRDQERKVTHGEGAARAVYYKVLEFDFGQIIDATQSLDKCVAEIQKSIQDNTCKTEIQIQDFPLKAQPNSYTCGPTSIEMILNFLKISYSTKQLLQACATRPEQGTDNDKMSEVVESFGLEQLTKQDATISDLVLALQNNKLCVVNYKNPNSGHGHFAVVIGFSSGNIILADPHDGKRREFSISQFLHAWENNDGTIPRWAMMVSGNV